MRKHLKPIHLLFFAVLLSVAPVVQAGTVFDDMTDPSLWTGPIYEYGNTNTGNAAIQDGILTIHHAPVAKWHAVTMKREWSAPFRPNTWFHFRFRIKEILLGADLYATLTVNETMVLQMGVNGEQHWIQGDNCKPKKYDDELFWGSNVIIGKVDGKKTDMRTALSKSVKGKVNYAEWTQVSMKYEVNDSGRCLRLFVNGEEIVYRDIDDAEPKGTIDNHIISAFDPGSDNVKISVAFANFTDGDLYGDTSVNDGAGVRWLHAFSDNTPAIPHPADPKAAIKKDSEMQWDYMMILDPADKMKYPKQLKTLKKERRFKPVVLHE